MLKDYFKQRQITQKQLQAISGIDQPTISRICQGKQQPTVKQVFLLEKYLGVPISYWRQQFTDERPQ